MFGFTIAIKDKPVTRRGILSLVSSVYDPLGFAAPFILIAKEILQNLCRMNLCWEDPIPEDHLRRWETWLKELRKLENLKLNHCFRPSGFSDVVKTELHHFSDASQQGYSAVSYLRTTDSKGNNHCAFVMGKSRLAPLKSVTIPRMELTAAVLATKLDRTIRKEVDLPIQESVFWTDSTCVLRYIENKDKRFHTFVANRISSIHDASSPSQWNHVDTGSNPADDASRGLQVDALLESKRWLDGPEFLWQSKEFWPKRPATMGEIEENNPEVKKKKSFVVTASQATSNMNEIFVRFSSWYRLKKFVAWTLRYRANLLMKTQKRREGDEPRPNEGGILPITVEEMNAAELEIVKFVQRESFTEETAALQSGTPNEAGKKTTKVQGGKRKTVKRIKSNLQARSCHSQRCLLRWWSPEKFLAPRSCKAPEHFTKEASRCGHHHCALPRDFLAFWIGICPCIGEAKILDCQSKSLHREGLEELFRLQEETSAHWGAENGRPTDRSRYRWKTSVYKRQRRLLRPYFR